MAAQRVKVMAGHASRQEVPEAVGRDAIGRLAAALRLRTVTAELSADDTGPAFASFRLLLETAFPRVHDRLERTVVGDRGALHYVWRGTDPHLEPWLFISHQDVVDAPDTGPRRWAHAPFAGAVADGFVWGRGAMDLKVSIMAVFEAVEGLLSEGFEPRRTMHLAFGADEEVGGDNGAALIAAALRRDGIRFAFSLDEGGVVASGVLPGVDRPVALVGIAEKGSLTVRITVDAGGGHSSMPARDAPVSRLLRLLEVVEAAAPAARLDGPTLVLLHRVSPAARPPYRWIYRFARLAAPLLLRRFRMNPAAAAATRTTLAVVGLSAGNGDNVIPASASATINYRILPGDSTSAILASLTTIAQAEDASLHVLESREASPVSDPGSVAFTVLAGVIRGSMPDVVVAPGLTLNATDSRHYESLVAEQFRFLPLMFEPEDLGRIHGVDERIRVESYALMIRFYIDFIRSADVDL